MRALPSTAAPRQIRWLGSANSVARWHSATHCRGDRFGQSHNCHQMAAMMALRKDAVSEPTFHQAHGQWGANRCTGEQ